MFEQLLHDSILAGLVALLDLEDGRLVGILFGVAELEEDVEPLGIVIVLVVVLRLDGQGEHVERGLL